MTTMRVTTGDGRVLHAERHGTGEPVVVFEAGMGMSRNVWGAVVPSVAARTTAVVYDRSGLGRSTPDPGRRDLGRLAGDLVDLLSQVGGERFVLVGHSWGGPIVRAAAAIVPERIEGIVLVDATDEGCELFFGAGMARQQRMAPTLLPVLARVGLLRAVARRHAGALPEPWSSGMRSEDGTASATAVQVAEFRTMVDDLRRLREHPPELPDVPLVVISGARTGRLERRRREALIAAHRERAASASVGRHVLANASSHHVPLTDPQVVAREVLSIVDAEPRTDTE